MSHMASLGSLFTRRTGQEDHCSCDECSPRLPGASGDVNEGHSPGRAQEQGRNEIHLQEQLTVPVSPILEVPCYSQLGNPKDSGME